LRHLMNHSFPTPPTVYETAEPEAPPFLRFLAQAMAFGSVSGLVFGALLSWVSGGGSIQAITVATKYLPELGWMNRLAWQSGLTIGLCVLGFAGVGLAVAFKLWDFIGASGRFMTLGASMRCGIIALIVGVVGVAPWVQRYHYRRAVSPAECVHAANVESERVIIGTAKVEPFLANPRAAYVVDPQAGRPRTAESCAEWVELFLLAPVETRRARLDTISTTDDNQALMTNALAAYDEIIRLYSQDYQALAKDIDQHGSLPDLKARLEAIDAKALPALEAKRQTARYTCAAYAQRHALPAPIIAQ
jgi:hypothetical protein